MEAKILSMANVEWFNVVPVIDVLPGKVPDGYFCESFYINIEQSR